MPNLAAFLAAREDEPQRLLIRETTPDFTVDWTADALIALAARWQSAFAAAQLNPGERVALSAHNSAQWFAIDQAALGLGLVVVALDPHASAQFAASCITHSGARLLLIDAAPHAREILAAGAAVEQVVLLQQTEQDHACFITLEAFLPSMHSAPFCVAELEEDALATLCYQRIGKDDVRSVMLSHSNLLAAVYAQQALYLFHEGEAVLTGSSFAHMFARVSGLYVSLALGAHATIASVDATLEASFWQCAPQVFLCDEAQLSQTAELARTALNSHTHIPSLRWQLDTAWRLAQGSGSWLDRAARRLSAPKLANALHQSTGGQLKRIMCGQPLSSIEAVRQLTAQGVTVLHGLSLDASGGLASLNRHAAPTSHMCGQALPGVELRLSDDGELLLRGLALTHGYWNDPPATQANIEPEGWLHTGLTAHLEGEHIMIEGLLPETPPQHTPQGSATPDLFMTNSTLPG